jgi:recombination protein RecA
MSAGSEKDAREKSRALEQAVALIERQFGKGAIMKLGEQSAHVKVDAIPTGSIGLDLALGIGGIPRGRVVEIFGPESSGKTTLTLSIIAEAQRLGGNAVFIDAEHALSPEYAARLGVDIENLHIAQPDTGEEALEIADQLVKSTAVDIVVIDSVAALVPKAEIEGEMGDSHVGLQARLMSQALRKLTGSISKSNTCVIFINQIRMKIGVMFGNPETTTGGNALKFYSSVRLDIRRIQSLKEKDEVIGSRTRVKVVKNKIAPPFRSAEFDILFNQGISREGELIDMALEKGIVTKTGTWLSYGEDRIGQGRENARLYLKENPALADDLEKKVRAAYAPMPEMLPAPRRAIADRAAPDRAAPDRGAAERAAADRAGAERAIAEKPAPERPREPDEEKRAPRARASS